MAGIGFLQRFGGAAPAPCRRAAESRRQPGGPIGRAIPHGARGAPLGTWILPRRGGTSPMGLPRVFAVARVVPVVARRPWPALLDRVEGRPPPRQSLPQRREASPSPRGNVADDRRLGGVAPRRRLPVPSRGGAVQRARTLADTGGGLAQEGPGEAARPAPLVLGRVGGGLPVLHRACDRAWRPRVRPARASLLSPRVSSPARPGVPARSSGLPPPRIASPASLAPLLVSGEGCGRVDSTAGVATTLATLFRTPPWPPPALLPPSPS